MAVKQAFRIAPRADIAFWADDRWIEWERPDLAGSPIPLKVSTLKPAPDLAPYVRFIASTRRYIGETRLSLDPAMIGGWCSGTGAVNLAFLFGPARIVLLGFDATGGSWHQGRRDSGDGPRPATIYTFRSMAPSLREQGCEVINATPGSAIDAFPTADPAQFLTG